MSSETEIETRATLIIQEAATLDPEARARFLDSRCASDPILHARVQARLANAPFLGPDASNDHLSIPLAGAPRESIGEGTVLEGTLIGAYRIIRLLGTGGFGSVYLAEQDEPVRRQVALKILKLGMDTDEIVRRFETERQVLALMNHPAVAKVFDAGATERGRPFFVMEFVPGVSIGRYCDRERLSTRERVQLFIDVCNAMQHAHQKGIIHRDLKPSNILVTVVDGRPQPKVIDFGIAKAIHESSAAHTLHTTPGVAIGTPEYMSPEQAEADGQDVDTRTDVYALGMVLYELLTGALPHTLDRTRRPSVFELREWVRSGQTIRPSTRISMLGDELEQVSEKRNTTPTGLRRELRGELEWIILKALERDRSLRYGSVFELGEDLSRFLANEPVRAAPPTASYRARKFCSRHRAAVSAAVVTASALLVGTGVALFGLVSAQHAAEDAKHAEHQTAIALRTAQTQRNQAQDARNEAEQDATRAREVSAFLERVLTSVDPAVAGPSARVLDALEVAEAQLHDDTFTHPVSKAAVHGALGEAYQSLSEYPSATKHLVAREALFTDIFGPDDPRTLRSRIALGSNYLHLAQFDRARQILESTRDQLIAQFGPDHLDTLWAHSALGRLELELGQFAEAETEFRIVLEANERNPDATVKDLAMARADLGWALMEQNRLDESQAIFRRVTTELNQALGPTHPLTLRTRDSLGNVLLILGRNDEAIAVYQEVLDARLATVGDENPLTLWAMNNLANAMTEDPDRYEEARSLLERVLELQRERFGNRHPFTVTSLNNLASVYRRLGNIDRADELWQEAITEGAALWGDDHPRTLGSMANRALMLVNADRLEEGLEILQTVVPRLEASVGREHTMWMAASNSLGNVLIKLERFDEAERCYADLVAVTRAALPPDHWYIFQFQSWHGIALIGLERYEEAEAEMLEAIAGLEAQFGPQHSRVLGVRQKIIDLYTTLDRTEERARFLARYPEPPTP